MWLLEIWDKITAPSRHSCREYCNIAMNTPHKNNKVAAPNSQNSVKIMCPIVHLPGIWIVVIPPSLGNNEYINPYQWGDDHPPYNPTFDHEICINLYKKGGWCNAEIDQHLTSVGLGVPDSNPNPCWRITNHQCFPRSTLAECCQHKDWCKPCHKCMQRISWTAVWQLLRYSWGSLGLKQ